MSFEMLDTERSLHRSSELVATLASVWPTPAGGGDRGSACRAETLRCFPPACRDRRAAGQEAANLILRNEAKSE